MYTNPKTKSNIEMSSPISSNYLKKIQSQTTLEEGLRAMLADFHENRTLESPYRLFMENPALKVSTKWYMTITAALDYLKIVTGDFKIYFKQRLLTLQECEAIRQCEEGELEPHSGCSIERAKEIRALREREQYEELLETRDQDEDDEYDELCALLEGDEEDQEMLEMWLEKMDRPGRKLARGSDESALTILLRMKEMRQKRKMSAIEF